MLVEDSQADELLLGVVVDGELVCSDCLVDTRHCLLRQILLQVLLVEYLQLKFGVVGCLFEVSHPQLSEEGCGVCGSL